MDLHISVIADFKSLNPDIEVIDWCLSGHSWVMNAGMWGSKGGVINIKNKQWARDFSPLDPGLSNEMSQYYTKAYMRHLFMADEILGLQLASIQNLSFYLWLVGQAREHIIAGDYTSWKKTMVAQISKRL
jgi:queuine tRNA-ribosyltransferase